ncbi:MAG: hypothetical protein J1F12_06570 [Muribaculaceae bacterium]|nr:hypothetical protein [Muribaculaceae bacterium]
MSLIDIFIRWRHSKGFGVHSPYAFRFVNDVVRPGVYKYYSYDELDSLLEGSERKNYRFQELIKFTLRLAVFLKTQRIVAPGKSRLAEIVSKALNLKRYGTLGTSGFLFQEGDLLISEKGNVKGEYLQKAIAENIPVFAIKPDEETRKILSSPIPRGVAFKDNERIVLIPREEMAYVSYDILLDVRTP